jgi:hypothetical protein
MNIRGRILFFGATLLVAALLPVGAAAQVPHYFPDGIERLQEPARQWEAYLRYMNSMDICRGTFGAKHIPRDFSRAIQVKRTYWGKETTFVFDTYVRVGDKIVFYDFCGDQVVTEEQFGVVRDYFIGQFEEAWDIGYEYYRDVEVLAVRARAEAVGKTEKELRANLDEPLPDAPGVTYRERQLLPDPITKAQFVPSKEIHLGYNPYFGVAWLNSGALWVTPQATVSDYIHGRPGIALHESIHTNENLQSYPLSNGVDVELIASVPMMFFPEDHLRLSHHGYARDIRDMVRWYFGYDFDQVRKEIVIFNHATNLRIDTEKFNKYYAQLQEVKAELLRIYPVFLAEYYSKRAYWSGFHEKMQDNAAVFRVMMALSYDLTALGGREKTMRFTQMHHDKIMRMAHESFMASGGGGKGSAMNADPRIPSQETIKQLELLTGMSREEMLKLAKKHQINLEGLHKMSTAQIIQLYMDIMEKERVLAEGGLQ